MVREPMTAIRRPLLLTMLGAMLLPSGFGTPAANVSLAGLLDRADAVVVAGITGTVPSGFGVEVNFLCKRAIKGSINAGTTVSAASSALFSPESIGARARSAQTGLWFLQRKGAGWSILPVVIGVVPLDAVYIKVPSGAPQEPFAYDASGSPDRKLACELAAAAQDPATARALARIASSGALDGLGSDLWLPILSRLSPSAASITRVIGLAGQIRFGIAAALAALMNAGPAAFSPEAQDYLSMAICQYRNVDAGGISALGSLANSEYAGRVRFCAVHALRVIHSKEALRYLAPFLDSASTRLQYEAVTGIASFANGLPVQTSKNTANLDFLAVPSNASIAADVQKNFPARRIFEKQPQTYVAFWKNWLLAHGMN